MFNFFLYLPAVISYADQDSDSTGTVYGELPGAEFNLFWSSVKLFIALMLTLLLLVAVVWVLRKILRANKIPGISGGALNVLEIRYIAPKKAVALVRVLERVFIVGVSENSLTTLGELTSEEIERLGTDVKNEPGAFRNILAGFTRKKEKEAR